MDSSTDAALGPARYEIRIEYACGCAERWAVYRKPAPDEESVRSDEDCDPVACAACAPYRLTVRGVLCPKGRRNVMGRPLVEKRA